VRKLIIVIGILLLVGAAVGWFLIDGLPPLRTIEGNSVRSYELRAGTHFSHGRFDKIFAAKLKPLVLPNFPGANSIWGATGRDDRGHIWIGISVQGEVAARLMEYNPNSDVFVDHGDPITALKEASLYREGEHQQKIHSKIIQANDGYLYFSSMDDGGESADGSRLPTWGSHLWRYDPIGRQWEHLLRVPEGLIAVSGTGRWIYALGYWDHILYQYDTETDEVRSIRVGSEGGHVSRNLIADDNGHVYVPRVKYFRLRGGTDAESEQLLITTLFEFDEHLIEVSSTPLIHYADKGKPRKHHGIVALSYLADKSIAFTTGAGYLYRIIPSKETAAELRELGWFHPEGASYTASLFPLDGKNLLIGISRRRGGGYHLVEFDLRSNTPRVLELEVPERPYLLLYGSNTRDNAGNCYVVGRYQWDTPLVWQLSSLAW
jgi:hypothetical protein